ncbi:hypothetical protein J2T02_002866 [Chitinophaga terrae (ex Kim and Jung 2007)]|jgi:hypothetical protein|uniref:hypothetical protein n=1 Tax=Chitinophaga terrae (ex Kim and Jung 2007) TaxID=408074 RepID=UPI0027850BD8|nr:hypothetical protein [Chitinophaga terrae (ex Kim and Jung 2007)]MDQ0107745.1 hypothetical protein [Chitinophaga terrae (ex Kim and Jung 2007)]
MNYRNGRGRKGLHILKFIFLGALFITAVGFLTMTLWNCLIPELFNGPHVTFWQALGLLLLGKLLFGWHNHHGGGPKGRWKERLRHKMENMTDEEKERMRDLWKKRCSAGFNSWGRDFWKEDDIEPKPKEPGREEPNI